MAPRRLIVLGTIGTQPYGVSWMYLQFVAGLVRLGHDAYYFEVTSDWPYDPVRRSKVDDSDYALPFVAQAAEQFGLTNRWAYRRSYSDNQWFGLSKMAAEELLWDADAVLNMSGATRARSRECLKMQRLVYWGTDPVYHEVAYAQGDEDARSIIDQHDDVITYGENIGASDCPLPPLPRLRGRTRQPVLLDLWESGPPSKPEFTTVGNWRQGGRDIEFKGETYRWSKHHEFLKFIDLPRRVAQPLELAMSLDEAETVQHRTDAVVPAFGLARHERLALESNGWRLTDAGAFSTDLWRYRDYICASKGEFTVAKDQNVRLRTGWFSERSACYLAAGRPVITQDTAFGKFIPTGEGLFSFNTTEEILAAFEAINSQYEKHSRMAREIAHEYFRAETVLAKALQDLGL